MFDSPLQPVQQIEKRQVLSLPFPSPSSNPRVVNKSEVVMANGK